MKYRYCSLSQSEFIEHTAITLVSNKQIWVETGKLRVTILEKREWSVGDHFCHYFNLLALGYALIFTQPINERRVVTLKSTSRGHQDHDNYSLFNNVN